MNSIQQNIGLVLILFFQVSAIQGANANEAVMPVQVNKSESFSNRYVDFIINPNSESLLYVKRNSAQQGYEFYIHRFEGNDDDLLLSRLSYLAPDPMSGLTSLSQIEFTPTGNGILILMSTGDLYYGAPDQQGLLKLNTDDTGVAIDFKLAKTEERVVFATSSGLYQFSIANRIVEPLLQGGYTLVDFIPNTNDLRLKLNEQCFRFSIAVKELIEYTECRGAFNPQGTLISYRLFSGSGNQTGFDPNLGTRSERTSKFFIKAPDNAETFEYFSKTDTIGTGMFATSSFYFDSPRLNVDKTLAIVVIDNVARSPSFSPGGPFKGTLRLLSTLDGNIIDLFADAPFDSNAIVQDSLITQDNSRVVYTIDRDGTDGERQNQLYSQRTRLGASPLLLNTPLDSFGSVVAFKVNEASSFVVYSADPNIDGSEELFVVSLNGGASVNLSGELAARRSISDFKISPNGENLVYLAVNDEAVYSLFKIDLPEVSLNPPNFCFPIKAEGKTALATICL